MRFTSFALAAAVAHGALAAPPRESRPAEQPFACGAPEPSAEHIQISQEFAAQEAAARSAGNFTTRAVTTVDVYFHVVAASTALSDGYVTVSTYLTNPPQPLDPVPSC